ncbi:hypothetical protein ACKI2N_002685 [Cupriavidus sp. 30B13]|uniref:hypothetical protein n=1 Tax=Cupriavidus sp. 30B13 TaxID=3384241 RepID=UPI003B90F968
MRLRILFVAVPVLAFTFFAAMSATGYAWLDWKTYTVITHVPVYKDIVDVPSSALVGEKPIAVLAPGTKCKLVQQYGKDINVSSRMRCENGVDGWVNESIAFDPVPPGPR